METESQYISPIQGNLSNLNVFENSLTNIARVQTDTVYDQTTLQDGEQTVIRGTQASYQEKPVSPSMNRQDKCFNHVNRAVDNSYCSEKTNFNRGCQTLNSLKVLYTNCDCLTQTKKCELINSIQQSNPDIIALTEIYPKHATFETSAAFFNIEIYDLI